MTSITMILGAMLALSLCVLIVEGGHNKCEVRRKGKMIKFNDKRFSIKIPCKYQAINFQCKGYHVRVVPGQALDSKARYFTDTVRVTIQKLGTNYYWIGRTSNKRVDMHFNNTNTKSWSTKEERMNGAPFEIKTSAKKSKRSVAVGVSNVHMQNFQVVFNAFDEKDKQLRKNAGIEIFCDDATYTEESYFPDSLCGNKTNSKELKDRRKQLGFNALTKTVIYDVLADEDVKQTRPQCEIAAYHFQNCAGDRTQVIKTCSAVISEKKIMKCLNKYHYNPMDVFVQCLKYQCSGDGDSCYLYKEAMDGCPSTPDLPTGPCPGSP